MFVIKIYTNTKLVREQIEDINDSLFGTETRYSDIRKIGKELHFDVDTCMLKLDHARILDDETKVVEIDFGPKRNIVDIECLSTGLKTVLNLVFLMNKKTSVALDVSECGANALAFIFALLTDYKGEIRIILRHSDVGLDKIKQEFIVDDLHTANNQRELGALLQRILGGDTDV